MTRTSPHTPGSFVAAMDAAVAICAVLALILACTGAYREVLGTGGGLVLSVGWMHAAFVAGAIAAIRHAAVPRPSILASITGWIDAGSRRPALADAMLAFWLTRPTIVLVGLVATATIGVAPAGKDALVERDPARSLPARWDAQWYAGLAAHGYQWQRSFDPQQNLAFFPAYPLLMRSLGVATGAFRPGVPPERLIGRLAWCGLLISLTAFFWAAWYFAKLAREMMEESRARASLLLLAAYPFALFFSAAYTESVFLLTALGAWFHFRRGEDLPAAGWGLLAGLTRPNGCFLSIPLGLLALGARDAPGGNASAETSLVRRLIVAAMPGIGMLLFTAYLYQVTGIWFAWSKTHAAWGRVIGAEPSLSSMTGFGPGGLLEFASEHPYDLLNGLGLLFAVLTVHAVWRFSPAWTAFVLVNVLVPLSAGGLLSMGRLTSTLFPMFLACGLLLPPRLATAAAVGFAIVQGLLAALFYTWRDVY
jgi:Mannosyltransferase (PIG-V)